ncbi:MAG: hypothetical protein VW875_00230 [Planctomycetaceae bacterium]
MKTDNLTQTAMQWLTRSHSNLVTWQECSRDVYFSCNGDNDLARQRVAALLRSHFLEEELVPEDVSRWTKDLEGQEIVRVEPPKLGLSNVGYVNWLYLADYFLLASGAESEKLSAENQVRSNDYQMLMSSFALQTHVYQIRLLLDANSDISDQEVIDSLQPQYEKISLANVKEARRQQKANTDLVEPLEPPVVQELQRYKPKFF